MAGSNLSGLLRLGILGSLVMLCGDMLMLGRPVSGAQFSELGLDSMTLIADWRLLLGGLLGIPSAFLLWRAFGFNLQLLPSSDMAIFSSRAYRTMSVLAGLYHLLVPVPWLVQRSDGVQIRDPAIVLSTMEHLLSGLLLSAALALGLAGLVLIWLLLQGMSGLPRWLILLVPGVPMIAVSAADWIPAPLGGFIAPAWMNLGLLAFFTGLLVTSRRCY